MSTPILETNITLPSNNILFIKIIIVIFSFIGSGLVIISTLNFGVGVSPDSVEYLATANNLLLGKGFLSFDGQPVSQWPPLYPMLLFLCSYTFGISTAMSAVIINTILFGLIIYKSGMVLTDYPTSNSIIIIGLLAILFSIPIFSIALWAWSELLFIFFTVWYIKSLGTYIQKENLRSFIIIVLATALAILTRYIGIILIMLTTITILYYSKERLKSKIFPIIIYSVLSITPVSIWLIRNYLISGTLFGERGASKYSILVNIFFTLETILSWENLDKFINLKMFIFLIITITIILLGILALKILKNNKILLKADNILLIILFSFISIYLCSLIFISSVKAHNPIDSRLLSPIYIPLTLLFLTILQATYNRIYSFKRYKQLRIAFFIFLIIGIANMFLSTLDTINHHYKEGDGYSGISWQKSSEDKWLKNIEQKYIKNSTIYCNDPFAVYYLENIHAKWSPRKTYYDSDEIYLLLRDLKGVWPPEKEAFIIWFNQVEFALEPLYTPSELSTISELCLQDSNYLGSLFLVSIKNN